MKKWVPRSVLHVEVLPGFKLRCHFDNNEIRIFDMSFVKKEKGPLIKPLKSQAFFKKVFIEMGTPTWPNGYDVCADLIYQEGVVAAVNSSTKKVS